MAFYFHIVETSLEGKLAILLNQEGQTDRTIPNNKPDIIFRGNEKGRNMLIDVIISGDGKKPRRF